MVRADGQGSEEKSVAQNTQQRRGRLHSQWPPASTPGPCSYHLLSLPQAELKRKVLLSPLAWFEVLFYFLLFKVVKWVYLRLGFGASEIRGYLGENDCYFLISVDLPQWLLMVLG